MGLLMIVNVNPDFWG